MWAIEECRHVSRRLEQALLAAGERVVRVAPQRIGASRKGEREPGKSDPIDALAVARAVVKDGVEEFPVLDRVDRRLRKLPAGVHVRIAREQVAHLRRLNRHIDELKAELHELVKAHRPQLLAEPG